MRLRLVAMAVGLGFVALSAHGETDAFVEYAHKAYVSFDGYEGGARLDEFPALVKIAEGSGDFSYADCRQADGGDVRTGWAHQRKVQAGCGR